MSKPSKVTPHDLAYRIEEEGLSYAVQHYYGREVECEADPAFEALWKAAYDAIVALDKHAQKHLSE